MAGSERGIWAGEGHQTERSKRTTELESHHIVPSTDDQSHWWVNTSSPNNSDRQTLLYALLRLLSLFTLLYCISLSATSTPFWNKTGLRISEVRLTNKQCQNLTSRTIVYFLFTQSPQWLVPGHLSYHHVHCQPAARRRRDGKLVQALKCFCYKGHKSSTLLIFHWPHSGVSSSTNNQLSHSPDTNWIFSNSLQFWH